MTGKEPLIPSPGARLAAALTLGLATTASAQNLIPDPAFAAGVSSWQPAAISGNYSMTFTPGFSKRPGSGSALLSSDGAAGGAFTVCVRVVAGGLYDWGYSVFCPDAARVTGMNESLTFYAGPGCTGATTGGSFIPIVATQTNAWIGPVSRVPIPAGTQTVLVGFADLGAGGARPFMYLDDVFFAAAGTVPPIDPIPGVAALSEAGLLALACALALAALGSLRGG